MTDRISSKADVLKSLYGKLKYSRVEKLKIVTGAELDADPYGLAAEIAEEFAGGPDTSSRSHLYESSTSLTALTTASPSEGSTPRILS